MLGVRRDDAAVEGPVPLLQRMEHVHLVAKTLSPPCFRSLSLCRTHFWLLQLSMPGGLCAAGWRHSLSETVAAAAVEQSQLEQPAQG